MKQGVVDGRFFNPVARVAEAGKVKEPFVVIF
jgi:hypothetical protein